MAKKGGVPKNLKPFKKGVDPRRNLDGRPPVLPELREALAKVLAEEQNGITALEAILKTLRNKALKGDTRAIQEILDRYFGKVKQDIGLNADINFEGLSETELDVIALKLYSYGKNNS
jgi:hypothetical protein